MVGESTEGWFCVWGIVAIQVEGQRSGMMTVEDRFVLVKACDARDAARRLGPAWKSYAAPYLNPDGDLFGGNWWRSRALHDDDTLYLRAPRCIRACER